TMLEGVVTATLRCLMGDYRCLCEEWGRNSRNRPQANTTVLKMMMTQDAPDDSASVLSSSSSCAEMVSNMETTTRPLTTREGLFFALNRMRHILAVWPLCPEYSAQEARTNSCRR